MSSLTPFQIDCLLWLIEGVVDVSLATNQVPKVRDAVLSAIAKHPGQTPGYWQMRSFLNLGARLGIFKISTSRSEDPTVERVKVAAGNFIQGSDDVSLLRAAAGAYCFCASQRDPRPDCTIEAQWDFVRRRLLVESCVESVGGVFTGARSPVFCGSCPVKFA